MKKTMKRFMALAMAIAVCFSQTSMSALASDNNRSYAGPKIELISVEETVEDVLVETTEEVTEVVEETAEETEVAEETTEEAAAEETTEEAETVEETTEETETVEETTEEATTEEITTEEATTEEETTEESTESVEVLFPGLASDDELSEEQVLDKKDLKAQTIAIGGYRPGIDYVEGEILVEAETLEQAEEFATAYNGTLAAYNEYRNIARIELADGVTVQQAVSASAGESYDGGVVLPAAWPNYLAHTCEGIVEPESEELELEDTVSGFSGYKDPSLKSQWHHEYMGSEYAWAEGYTGRGVKVAVIDTGIRKTHQDLSANAVDGRNFYGSAVGATDNNDYNGHGTHVAGIVAADGNNSYGGSGVAPDATVRSYRVFGSSGGATDYDIIEAIDQAVADGNHIINMSLGGPGYYKPYHNSIKDAQKAGVAVFVAAGNEYNNGGDVYPANYSEAITIAAIDLSGGAATFSNFGNHVDLAFPGVDIYSTYNNFDDSYTYMDGTSMATPAAAGAAAVILSANPKSLQGKTGKAKVNALVSLMKNNAKKSSSAGMGKGTTWIPKACGLSGQGAAPVAPKFSVAQGTYYTNSMVVKLSAELGKAIYYSTNGKAPTYKNGEVLNGSRYDNSAGVTVTGAKKVTVKAIAVGDNGKASKVATAVYTLQPDPVSATVVSKTNINTVQKGKSLQLQATVSPSYAISTKVKWSITPENQGVIVDNKGLVKATKDAIAQTYTISANPVDKNGDVYTNASAGTYNVTVLDATTIAKIKAKQETVNVILNSNTNRQLGLESYVSILDKDGNEILTGGYATLAWKSSNTNVVNNSCYVVGPGKAKMTGTAKDGSGKTVTITVKVSQEVSAITISGSNNLSKGKSIKLATAVAPANASNTKFTWTVSPENQGVTVNNGKVTATAKATEGTYFVRAAANDGSGVVSNSFQVVVIGGTINNIKVPNKATIFTSKGNANAPTTYQINPEITGTEGFNGSLITYTSNAPAVATVNQSGLVTAKSVGTAKITIAATDGSNKSATVTIKVNNPMSALKIAPKGGATNYIAKGKKVAYGTLAYNDFGTVTDKKVTWEVADTSIAKVDKNGNVQGKNTGTTTLIARAADGCGVSATYSITVVKAPTYMQLVPVDYAFYSNGFSLVLLLDTNAGIINNTAAYKVEFSGGKNASVITNYMNAVELFITKSGTYSVKVTLLDGSKKSSTYRFRVTL